MVLELIWKTLINLKLIKSLTKEQVINRLVLQ